MTKTKNSVYYFSINSSYQECLAIYQGTTPNAILTSESGKTVQIPSYNLRKFIDSRGLKGRFRLIISSENKIIQFERVA